MRCPLGTLLSSVDLLLYHGAQALLPAAHSHHCILLVFSTAPASPALSEPPICLFLLIKGPCKERWAGQPWSLAYEEQSTLFQD